MHEVPRCTVGPSRLFVHRTILILKILGFSQIETRVTTVIGTNGACGGGVAEIESHRRRQEEARTCYDFSTTE